MKDIIQMLHRKKMNPSSVTKSEKKKMKKMIRSLNGMFDSDDDHKQNDGVQQKVEKLDIIGSPSDLEISNSFPSDDVTTGTDDVIGIGEDPIKCALLAKIDTLRDFITLFRMNKETLEMKIDVKELEIDGLQSKILAEQNTQCSRCMKDTQKDSTEESV